MQSQIVCTTLCAFVIIAPAPSFGGAGKAADVVIIFEGSGAKAKYVEKGKKKQAPVIVFVGESVKWVNNGDASHTSTAYKKVNNKYIFDTGRFRAGKSATIVFDKKIFANAGGKAGGKVSIRYFCIPHKRYMKSEIVLVDGKRK